jgi:5-methylcytosine-specific restriction endonuclease McrA
MAVTILFTIIIIFIIVGILFPNNESTEEEPYNIITSEFGTKHRDKVLPKRYRKRIVIPPIHRIGMYITAEEKAEYLQSKEWKTFRTTIHNKYNHKCTVCGSTKRLEVHHNTYERLGAEKIGDCTLLCRTHHQQIHDIAGYSRETLFPISLIAQR